MDKITSLYKISKTRTNQNNDNFTFNQALYLSL